MATRKITLEDGNGLLLEDGASFLVKDGVAQASDDVLIRMGPLTTTTDHSGLVAPFFTASAPAGGTAVFGGMYYAMMQNWFEAA